MALTTSLVACWELEEASGTRNDAHGTNHLTDNNTVTSGTGKVATAASFARANQESLTITDNAALSMGDIDFTIAAWVNRASSVDAGVVSKWDIPGSKREYVFDIESSIATFYVSPDGSSSTSITASTFGDLGTSAWRYVICWHDATANTINICVNDGAVDSTAHTTGVLDSTATFYLGSLNDLTGNGFSLDGLLDQVCIWKRVLTSGERTSMYNGGSGLSYAAMSGAVAFFPPFTKPVRQAVNRASTY